MTMLENRKDRPVNEELYVDVVSRTIISRLSESIAQIMSEKLTDSLDKLLITGLPEVISKEITPLFDREQKEILKAVEGWGGKLHNEIKGIRQQMERSSMEQSGVLANILQTTKKLTKTSQEKDTDTPNEIKQTLDMGIRGMVKQLEKGNSIHQAIKKELVDVSKEMERTANGNTALLNSIFSSVKKLTTVYNKKQDMDKLPKERKHEIEEELLDYKRKQMEEFDLHLKTQREYIIKDLGETRNREESKIKSQALALFEAQKVKILEYFEDLKDKESHEAHTNLKDFLDDKQRELDGLLGGTKQE
jgi:hypothetical protein